MTARKVRTPLTELERRACLAIEFPRVNYRPASPEKRFSRGMGAEARLERGGLTDRQRECLWKHVWRYRRQIDDAELVRIAEEMISGQRSFLT